METTPDRPRTFAVRTLGCQMNAHDSERMAGLLIADGLVPVANSADHGQCDLAEAVLQAGANFFGLLQHFRVGLSGRRRLG